MASEQRVGAGAGSAQVPAATKRNLVACRLCKIVKTLEQFVEDGCDNCTFLQLHEGYERVASCTTRHFSGYLPSFPLS